MTITFEPLNDAARLMLANDVEDRLSLVHEQQDNLKQAIDRLAHRVQLLMTERAHIIDILSTFYTSDISMSSLQPVLECAVLLNPSLKESR